MMNSARTFPARVAASPAAAAAAKTARSAHPPAHLQHTIGNRAVQRLLRVQPKLKVGAPSDVFEQEADDVARSLMRMPEPAVQRMCGHREEELQAKAEPGQIPEAPDGFEQRFAALHGGGQPLPASERAFFEPRFGRDFADVRLHSGPAAAELAHSVQARAFTVGNWIVLGSGQYAAGAAAGRELLAHELTHVVQQGAAGGERVIRRQTIHSSCAGRDRILTEAWAEGQRLVHDTAGRLDTVVESMRYGLDMSSSFIGRLIRSYFGSDIGLAPGDLTHLPDLITRYRRIEDGFIAGRTLRCDTSSVPTAHRDECDRFSAFVMPGNNTDVFICEGFLAPTKTVNERGVTLLHEMAHSVLRIGHEGGELYHFGCDIALGLDYEVAKRNAYPYAILANCLAGAGASEGESVTVRPPDRRWSLSASAGADLTPSVERFAGVLGGRYSLRSGQLAIFNPIIGANILYLPSGATREHLVAATIDAGLRIQQPLRGAYFDLTVGGLGGFTVDATGGPRGTAGLTGTVGLGWRWERIELGAEARGLITSADPGSVLVLGRLAVRLP